MGPLGRESGMDQHRGISKEHNQTKELGRTILKEKNLSKGVNGDSVFRNATINPKSGYNNKSQVTGNNKSQKIQQFNSSNVWQLLLAHIPVKGWVINPDEHGLLDGPGDVLGLHLHYREIF